MLRRLTLDASRGAAACLLIAGNAYAGSISVTLKCRTGPSCEARGTLVLQSLRDPSVVRRVPFATQNVPIAEQPGSEWDMTVDAKGLWSLPERVIFPATDMAVPHALAVWRTGTLQGQMKFAGGPSASPPAVKVVVASRPEPRIPPEIPRNTSFDCTTETNAQFKCAIPATLLDIAVRAEGYAPFHKWDVKVPAAGAVDLGTVTLQKGASLVAWLDSDFAKRVEVPVRAVLRYEAAAGLSPTAARLALPVAEGVFSKKGVVQLAPIAPGRYILEVQAKGYAPARIQAELYAGKETTPRRSIDLSPALRTRLLIQPALGPGSVPWRVQLWRPYEYGPGSRDAGSGTASREGIFDAGEQSEGEIHVFVMDARRNVMATRNVTITAGVTDYTVKTDVSTVSGSVTLGGDPLPDASLLFGGASGAEKVYATTDPEGHFTITLPRRGKWVVDIEAPKYAVASSTDTVIEKDEVVIALPNTEVSGWVLDADGKRAPGATVQLTTGWSMSRRTEADGTFRFRGVRSGPAKLTARDGRSPDYSRMVQITVAEEGKVENIELDLDAVRPFKAIVRSNGDPVVGALVHGFAFRGTSAEWREATTDLQGAFSIDVPSSASEIIFVVSAPGRTLDSFSVLPKTPEPVVLNLAPRGGTLKLRYIPEKSEHGEWRMEFMFNGHRTSVIDIFMWARAQGSRGQSDGTQTHIEFPNLAPGVYRFCSSGHCAEGFLAAGAELALDATH